MKRLLVLLTTVIAICTVFVSCSDTTLSLKDWDNTNIEVNLGDKVELITIDAEDTAGNKYSVTTEVKTTAGDDVVIIGNEFVAENLGGYKIIYSAIIDENTKIQKQVTVIVKDTEKPIIRVSGDSFVFANISFDIPVVTVTDNSLEEITPIIKLYRVEGEDRQEILFQTSTIKLQSVGNYVFVITATDSSGNIEVKEHELTVLDNKYVNAVTIFKEGNELGFGAKVDSPLIDGNYGFSADVKRTALSEGTAYVDTKMGNTVYEYPNFYIEAPVISKQDFILAMEEEGAYLSIWVYVDSNENVDLRFMIDWTNPTLVNVLTKKQWINIKITEERIADAGFTLETYYDLFTSSGTFMFVRNYGLKECRIYFDSIYIAKDGVIEFDMPQTIFNIDDEIEIVVISNDVNMFVYEITAGIETRYFNTPVFTPWATGTTIINAMSAYGNINASATINLTISGPRVLDGAVQYFDGEGDLGFGVKPDGINIGNSGFDIDFKRTAASEGSAYIDTGTGQYPNLFITNPILSKADFVAAMNEEGAYLSIWVYVTSSSSVIDVRFVIDWGSAIEQITVKNQWVNVKLTKARILEGFASLEAYYDTIASSGRFMFINNLSYAPKDCRIYFDSIYVAKDGAITIDMPQTEFNISDEIEIVATSDEVDKLVYEVTAGGETRYYDIPTFTPWVAGVATVKIMSAYGNINATATIELTILEG